MVLKGTGEFIYCKTLPVRLPEADCSIFTLLVVVVTFCHHKTFHKGQKPDLCASYHTQCIISASSLHIQLSARGEIVQKSYVY